MTIYMRIDNRKMLDLKTVYDVWRRYPHARIHTSFSKETDAGGQNPLRRWLVFHI